MKKALLSILLLTAVTRTVNAQTFSEWFRQNKTQIKYLLQQIAALQVYAGFVEKGYSIAHDGLTAINDIKQGDFNLHDGYFKSLKNVNPRIEKSAHLIDIAAAEVQTEQVCKRTLKQVKESKEINTDEAAYIRLVFAKLLEGCKTDKNMLALLLSPNELQLKDDERLTKVNALYSDMQEKYTFSGSFANEVQQLVLNRAGEEREIENERKLLDVKR